MPASPDEALWVIRQLRHTKGKYAGQPFMVKDFQEKFVRELLSLDRKGRRKVQRALFGIARKNGKTELIAALAIALMITDREPGGEIVGAAAKRDQARLMLDAAKRMVWYSKIGGRPLSDFIIVRRDGLYYPEMDTRYIIVSADGEKEHGLNPHVVLMDEYHAQGRKRDLVEALVTAQGAREDPLFIGLTTAGPELAGPCYDEYQYMRKVHAGVINDPSFYGLWFEADKELAVNDPVAWKQANPGYPDFVQERFLQRQSRDVLAGKLPEYTFRRLHLNQWTTALERWLPRKHWEACAGPVEIPDGAPVFIAVDAALKRDSFGVAVVYVADGWADDPETGLAVPAKVAHVKVRAFTPDQDGEYIDQDDVRTYILGLARRYRCEKLLYDPAYMTLMAQQLADAGIAIEPFPQSPERMTVATETLQRLVLAHRLRHGNDRVLDEQMASVGTRETDRGVRLSKAKSGQIDVISAMVMGLDAALGDEGTQDFAMVV